MPTGAFIQKRATPRCARRVIGGPQKSRLALDENQRLALIKGMIAERHTIGAGIYEIVTDRLGDAETAGGILAVDDDEMQRPVAAKPRQMFEHACAAGATDNITNEEKTHAFVRSGSRSFRAQLSRMRAAGRAARRE